MTNRKGSVLVLVVIFLVVVGILGVVLYKYGFLGGYNPVSIPDRKVDVNGDQTQQINKLEPGDDIGSIEKDLSGTNLDTIDSDVLGVNQAADSQ